MCNVTSNRTSRPASKVGIIKNAAGKDVILCTVSDKIDEVMDAARNRQNFLLTGGPIIGGAAKLDVQYWIGLNSTIK